jgi:hypothetical protein
MEWKRLRASKVEREKAGMMGMMGRYNACLFSVVSCLKVMACVYCVVFISLVGEFEWWVVLLEEGVLYHGSMGAWEVKEEEWIEGGKTEILSIKTLPVFR